MTLANSDNPHPTQGEISSPKNTGDRISTEPWPHGQSLTDLVLLDQAFSVNPAAENSSCQKRWGFLSSRSFSKHRPGRSPIISFKVRLLLALLGIGLLTLLGTAFILRPSAEGYGTHQQLGLPPCTFIVLYGRRCPACGMTTAWSHLMRGQLPSALAANVGGTLLGGLAILVAHWSFLCAARGRWWIFQPNDYLVVALIVVVAVVTVSDWAVRLAVK